MTQFNRYFELLVEWNEKINLTAITEKEEVYLKHFYDSLTVAMHVELADKPYSLVDVGSGAGFPSIPLKIALPNLEITIVDSLNKRINFINEVVSELGLKAFMLTMIGQKLLVKTHNFVDNLTLQRLVLWHG